jgi:uncharacterized OB-fold protein
MGMTADDGFFWNGVDAGRLLAQCCTSCGTVRHPPLPMCGECHSLGWREEELKGTGTIFSWLISKHPSEPDAEPRTVVLVTLDEGIRVVANAPTGEEVAIGDTVKVSFSDARGVRLLSAIRECAI